MRGFSKLLKQCNFLSIFFEFLKIVNLILFSNDILNKIIIIIISLKQKVLENIPLIEMNCK